MNDQPENENDPRVVESHDPASLSDAKTSVVTQPTQLGAINEDPEWASDVEKQERNKLGWEGAAERVLRNFGS